MDCTNLNIASILPTLSPSSFHALHLALTSLASHMDGCGSLHGPWSASCESAYSSSRSGSSTDVSSLKGPS